jgi:BCD family chlorophyll transporter-like MFS transporter
MRGDLGATLTVAATGYGAVYMLEIVLLFATIAVIGPLVSVARPRPSTSLGLAGSPS